MKQITHLPLVDVSPDPLYPFRFDSDLQKLKTSLQTQGLFYPLCVIKNKKGHSILDGWRRFLILKELGFNDAPCFVYEESEMTLEQRFLFMLELNTSRQDLNIVETARCLRFAFEIFGDGSIPKRFWDLIGISQRPQQVQIFKDLLKLPESILKFLVKNRIAPTTAALFLLFPESEREKLASCLFVLPLNQNKLAEILELLHDIIVRDQVSALSVLESIFSENKNQSSLHQKEQFLRTELHKKRNPLFEKKMADFKNWRAKLSLSKTTQVMPAPFFEEDYLAVTTRFSNEKEIDEFIKSLQEKNWKEFFKRDS